MNPEDLKNEVKAAMEAAEVVPSSTPENVPAAEAVKEPVVEPIVEPIVPVIEKDAGKLSEQVGNLNTALKAERESTKKMKEDFERRLAESNAITDKLKNVFVPESVVEPEVPVYATADDIERAVEAKLQKIKEEQSQNQKIEEYKTEIKNLETEWNGAEGKPKYDDEEVLNWQRDNDKTYLSPRDAFNQMKHNELVDWEVKQRLTNAKPVIEVEKPSGTPVNHEPGDRVSNRTLDTKAAILQAMNDAEKEM